MLNPPRARSTYAIYSTSKNDGTLRGWESASTISVAFDSCALNRARQLTDEADGLYSDELDYEPSMELDQASSFVVSVAGGGMSFIHS